MTAAAPFSDRLVEAKTIIPPVSERLLVRPRLDVAFAALLQ
jgi:hypothetical protein